MTQTVNQWEVFPGSEGTFIRGSKWIDAMYLAVAGTAETYTVPAGVKRVTFSCPFNFWVRYTGGAAAVPSAEVTTGVSAEMNPYGRICAEGDTFSFVSQDNNCPISIACFS